MKTGTLPPATQLCSCPRLHYASAIQRRSCPKKEVRQLRCLQLACKTMTVWCCIDARRQSDQVQRASCQFFGVAHIQQASSQTGRWRHDRVQFLSAGQRVGTRAHSTARARRSYERRINSSGRMDWSSRISWENCEARRVHGKAGDAAVGNVEQYAIEALDVQRLGKDGLSSLRGLADDWRGDVTGMFPGKQASGKTAASKSSARLRGFAAELFSHRDRKQGQASAQHPSARALVKSGEASTA